MTEFVEKIVDKVADREAARRKREIDDLTKVGLLIDNTRNTFPLTHTFNKGVITLHLTSNPLFKSSKYSL